MIYLPDVVSTEVQLFDLVDGNTERLDAFLNLFCETFPQYAQVAQRLAQKAALPANANLDFIAHQWLLEIGQIPAGLCSFKYNPRRNLGLVVFIAVAERFRRTILENMRLSEWLIYGSIQQMQEDARSLNRPSPDGLILEVEPLRLVERYRQFGFVTLPVDYWEPLYLHPRQGVAGPTDLSQVQFSSRFLGAFPVGNRPVAVNSPAFCKRVLSMLAFDHYHIPEEHWSIQKAFQSIAWMRE